MEKLISVAVMRASDAAEIAGGTDSKTLMYRAGLGLFQSWDWHGKIDIVTGSGNNAGDGWRSCSASTASPAGSSAPAKKFPRTAVISSPSVKNGAFPSRTAWTFPTRTSL